MDSIVHVKGISRRFGRQTALQGLDFSLATGEVLGLLGQNGAGKTTCLRILAGDLAPSEGVVSIGGDDLAANPLRVKQRIGYLPERPALHAEMRVDEFLRFRARLQRIPSASAARALARSKRQCGLNDVGPRLIGQLSKGYRQRVGLAAALLHEPELLILDEPTDGLDPVQIREVRSLIRTLSERAAVILSSHALAEIQASCGRVIVLHQGRILHDGRLDTPPDLLLRLARPPSISVLQGLPGVLAIGKLDDGFRIRLAPQAAAERLAEAVVRAGWGLLEFRPERSDVERIFFASIGSETNG